MISDQEYKKIWDGPITRVGITTMVLASIAVFFPAIYLCVSEGISPNWTLAFEAFGISASAFAVIYVIEPVTYYAIVGLSGTYIAFLTGNLSNVRIPCAAVALEVTGVTPGTREGEIVSTLGIAGSAITSIFFTTLAVLIGSQVLAMLPQSVVDAISKYTVPAIFGAVFAQFTMKDIRIGLFSVLITVLLQVVLKIPVFYLMISCVLGTVLFARFLYVYDKKKAEKSPDPTV